jgi:uncharacterized protein with PhoU and TrkA domain
MDFLLGIEPLTALVVAAGAVVLAPVVSLLGNTLGNSSLGQSISQSARDVTKDALVFGIEVIENTQTAIAEAQESFQDIVAEAKSEYASKKNAEKVEPREVTIVTE